LLSQKVFEFSTFLVVSEKRDVSPLNSLLNVPIKMTAGANIPEEILHAMEKLKGLSPPTTHRFMLASIAMSTIMSSE